MNFMRPHVDGGVSFVICGKEREVSMKFYDEQLQKLQEQIARKRQLEAQVSELRTQRSTLSARARELEAIKMQEEADVDKLEGRSLAAFFYNVIGKMDEQLNKEREEAYAARVKYDAAARELSAVEDELARYEAELAGLRDCERQYDAVLKEKAGAVKAAGGTAAEEILKAEERLAFLNSQSRELREAVSAGNSALSTANQVLSSLDSAEGWGTWDLFGGGIPAPKPSERISSGAVENPACIALSISGIPGPWSARIISILSP